MIYNLKVILKVKAISISYQVWVEHFQDVAYKHLCVYISAKMMNSVAVLASSSHGSSTGWAWSQYTSCPWFESLSGLLRPLHFWACQGWIIPRANLGESWARVFIKTKGWEVYSRHQPNGWQDLAVRGQAFCGSPIRRVWYLKWLSIATVNQVSEVWILVGSV